MRQGDGDCTERPGQGGQLRLWESPASTLASSTDQGNGLHVAERPIFSCLADRWRIAARLVSLQRQF